MAGKPRVSYPKAERLHGDGLTVRQVARKLGVSHQTAWRAGDPAARKRLNDDAKRRARDNRVPCKGGCGTPVYPGTPSRPRTGYCRPCLYRRD